MGRGSSVGYQIIYLLVGFLYPAYASLHAISSPGTKDDVVWLAYWVVFSLFSIVEFIADNLLSWLPLYTSMKVAFLAWCVAPLPYNGAFYTYKVFVEPFFHYYGDRVDHFVYDVKFKAGSMIPPYPNEELGL